MTAPVIKHVDLHAKLLKIRSLLPYHIHEHSAFTQLFYQL